jgi:hypothetical protein
LADRLVQVRNSDRHQVHAQDRSLRIFFAAPRCALEIAAVNHQSMILYLIFSKITYRVESLIQVKVGG